MFKINDKVIIKHQKDLGVMTVSIPKDPTDIKRVGSGEPVGYYVRIENERLKNLGYHENNLEKING